jgi:hypothetical protein
MLRARERFGKRFTVRAGPSAVCDPVGPAGHQGGLPSTPEVLHPRLQRLTLEMKIVLRAVIERDMLFPVDDRPETAGGAASQSVLRAAAKSSWPRPSGEGEPMAQERIPALA